MTETRVPWRRHRLAVLLLAVAGGFAVETRADTLIVPDQYPTVQAAIDAAASGNVVQVRPGTYAEALSIEGKSLVIEGLGGQPVIAPGSMAKGILARCDSLDLENVAIVGARVGIIAKVRDLTLVGVDVSG